MGAVKTKDKIGYVKNLTTERSREVTEADVERVLKDSYDIYLLCYVPRGVHANGAHAIAHCQVTDDDPLRFFVSREGAIFINPEIVKHTKKLDMKPEGCMSFADKSPKPVERFYKCEVKYQMINDEALEEVNGRMKLRNDFDGELFVTHELQVKGIQAQVFQHECDHMEGKHIYETIQQTQKENSAA